MNDYYFSTIQSSKSFLVNQLKQKNSLERVPINYGLSPISFDERQLNQEKKAKEFLSTSSVLFPTYFDRSNVKEKLNLNNSLSLSSVSSDNLNQSHYFTSTPNCPSNSSVLSIPYTSNVYPLNIMSKNHAYDQRISDQGNKYIIQLKTDDYQENEFTITPRSFQNQLIIDAKHNEEDSFGGFIRRELHKIFVIPKHIDLNKYTHSYNKITQELTIEMPYINETKLDSNQGLTFSYENLNLTNGEQFSSRMNSSNNTSGLGTTINNSKPFDFDTFHRSAFRPQILSTSTNDNKLLMSLDLSDYQPEDIKITIKDQEIIVKAERKMQTDTKKSRTSFFQSTSLPPQTDIEHLQSNYIDGKLIIEAPYLERKTNTNE